MINFIDLINAKNFMKHALIDLIFNGKKYFENIQKFQITDVFEMAVV